MSSPISLVTLGGLTGAIPIGFGINLLLRPAHGLSFFEIPFPSSTSADFVTVAALTQAYAVRDIFMGVAIFAAAAHGARRSLGWILLATAAVGVADGVVCLNFGTGAEMNHFSYAPIIALLGLGLLR